MLSGLLMDLVLATLRSVVTLYDVLTFPIFLVIQRGEFRRRTRQPLGKVELVERSEESVSYRRLRGDSGMYERIIEHAQVDTMPKAFQWAVMQYGDRPCLGTRAVLAESHEDRPGGKTFQKLSLGSYSWLSYNQVQIMVENFAKGLETLAFNSEKDVRRIAIFAETRMEWLVSCLACFEQGISVCTIYANLGVDALVHALNETGAKTVITSHELLAKLSSNLPAHIEHIVYFEDAYKTAIGKIDGKSVSLNTFEQIVDAGAKLVKTRMGSAVLPSDVAVIMYTSGSTGTPKGVELTHANLIATMTCLMFMLEPQQEELYIAFLPLAHVLELLSENTMMLFGVRVGYSSPHTMTDASSKICRGQKGDASLLKPTLMCAVPLILDRIVKNVRDAMESRGPVFNVLFEFCYNYKLKWLKRGWETPLLDRILFNKIKALLGGKIRMILSGGAPLSADTHDFIRTCLGPLIVVQGYSLTESCCTGTVMQNDDFETGHVGQPMTGVEVRLVSWNEGGYTVKDQPWPRGEILLSGSQLAKGYFNQSALTSSSFFVDSDNRRWFRTGDIGRFDHQGRLTIIDRRKDLVKLQLGEYVSLGKIEALLKTHPLIDQLCVHADPTRTCTVALVVPNPKHLLALASQSLNKTCNDIRSLCEDDEVVNAVLEELRQLGMKLGLERFEVPQAITLVSDQWTPESGLITAAFKLKRSVVNKCYRQDLSKMYADMA